MILIIINALAVLVVVAATMVIWQFDRFCWGGLKDLLARGWKPRRREVLHLEKQNGFFYFIDKLIPGTEAVLRVAAGVALVTLVVDARRFPIALVLVASGYLVRSAVVLSLARRRVREYSLPLDYDCYGSYARSAQDWRDLGRAHFGWMMASGVAIGIVVWFLATS